MNMFSPSEIIENYSNIGAKKASASISKLLLLSILAGFLIGAGAAVSNTAAHSIPNISAIRIISGLLFPLGLGIVMLTGTELFTGNCMICISVLDRKTTVINMLKNWFFVYTGNLVGGLLLAVGCAWFGQLDYSNGGLAVYTIKVAATKCAIPFGSAVVMGIFCNILVCLGIICSLSAKDTAGRIMGAYIPVAFFVICGFEHSVANMFYIPAGIFAAAVPRYAAMAAEAGVNMSVLTWGKFVVGNLLPVTLGNVVGGVGVGFLLWKCHGVR